VGAGFMRAVLAKTLTQLTIAFMTR
jgi:hypothetical protein